MPDLEPYLRLIYVGGGLLVALLVLLALRRGASVRREQARVVIGLTPGHALHVVDVAGRRLLVGTGPSGAPRLLLELEDASTPPWAAARAGETPRWAAEATRQGPEGWGGDGA